MNCRIVAVQEIGEREVINTGILKEFSGNDRLYYRGLYKESESNVPLFKLLFIQNKNPNLMTTDKAVWNRVRVVPFNTEFVEDLSEEEEQNTSKKKMIKDFKFSLEDKQAFLHLLFQLYKKGYDSYTPEIVLIATKQTEMRNNEVLSFMTENYIKNGNKMTLFEVWNHFKDMYFDTFKRKIEWKKEDFMTELRKIYPNEIDGRCISLGRIYEEEQKEIVVVDNDEVKLENFLRNYVRDDTLLFRQAKVLELLELPKQLTQKITKLMLSGKFSEYVNFEKDNSNGHKWKMKLKI
jgi:hypothetical protein